MANAEERLGDIKAAIEGLEHGLEWLSELRKENTGIGRISTTLKLAKNVLQDELRLLDAAKQEQKQLQSEGPQLWETLRNTESEKGWWDITFRDGGVFVSNHSDEKKEFEIELSVDEWKDLIELINRISKPAK